MSGAVLYEHDGFETETDSFIFSVYESTNTVDKQMFSISIELPVSTEAETTETEEPNLSP